MKSSPSILAYQILGSRAGSVAFLGVSGLPFAMPSSAGCHVCPMANATPHLSFISPAVPGLGTVPFSFAPSLISAERLSLPGHHKPLGRTRSEPLPQNPKAIQQQLVYQQHHTQFLERLKQQTHLGKVSHGGPAQACRR